jgi:hypothetical protein
LLHRVRLTAHVYQAHRYVQLGCRGQRARIPQRANIIDEASTSGHRLTHHLGTRGIDRDRCRPHEGFDDGDDTCDFVGHRRRASPRAGGFTTDVEQFGALLDERMSVVDRGGRIDVPAAVGKRVGRDVDNSAHQRCPVRQLAQQVIAGADR